MIISKMADKGFWHTFLLLSLFPLFSSAQDMGYARKVLDTLTSPGLHGRGYVNDGAVLAARFLRNEFRAHGLKPFNNSLYQDFTTDVNTFPGNMAVSVNDKALTPGKDFLVESSSVSVAGTYDALLFDKTVYGDKNIYKKYKKKDLSDKVVIIDPAGFEADLEEIRNCIDPYSPQQCPSYKVASKFVLFSLLSGKYSARALIILTDSLPPWDVSDFTYGRILIVKRSSIPSLSGKITVTLDIRHEFLSETVQHNVVGYLPGHVAPDSFIVFTAHYDHLGRMGRDTWFPGANDNASGTAMLLNLARHYASLRDSLRYSMVFIAFAAEENRIAGSRYFTENPLFPLEKIRFLINMDILGTGDDGIMVVNGALFEKEWELMQKINQEKNYLKVIGKRPEAANSDHYWFTKKGVPSFFIYTLGGIAAYHNIYDRAETLPLTEFEDVFRLITDFIEQL